MLFHLKKWIILFQLVILAPALFSLLVNGSRGHASDFEDSGYFAIALSLGNFGKPQSINSSDQNLMYVQSYCHMAALLVILVLSFFFSKSQKDLELRMDQGHNTPSDYALFVRGIPADVKEEEVKTAFEKEWEADRLEVHSVERIYDCGELLTKERKLLQLKTKEAFVNLSKASLLQDHLDKNPKYQRREEDLVVYERRWLFCKQPIDCQTLQREITQLERQVEYCCNHLHKTPKCLVLFHHQRDVRMLDQKFGFNLCCRLWFWCRAKQCNKKVKEYPMLEFNGETHIYHDRHIIIKRAPEPTDLRWQNLSVSFQTRLAKILLTFLATLGLIGFAFLIYYLVKSYQTELEEEYLEKKQRGEDISADYLKVRGLSFLISIVLVFFNRIQLIVIGILSSKEKHQTQTYEIVSVGFKITLASFVLSALLPCIVNNDKEELWFSNRGLVVDITYNVIIISFITPLLYLVDIFYLVRVCTRCVEQRKRQSTLTQKQANQLMEGSFLDMGRLHSNTFRFFLITVFFSPLSPLVAFIALFGSVFAYWAQKYILLRRAKQPCALGPELAYFYGDLIVWSLPLYAFSNWLWVSSVSKGGHNTPAAVMCVALLIYMVIPVRGIVKGCNKKHSDPDSQVYEDALPQFPAQYKTENPVSRVS